MQRQGTKLGLRRRSHVRRWIVLVAGVAVLATACSTPSAKPASSSPTAPTSAGSGGSGTVTADAMVTAQSKVVAATPTFRQQASAMPLNGQTVSVAYPRAEVAGDTNVVVVGWNDATSTVNSVIDSAGNTYQIAAPIARGTALSQAIYYAANVSAAGAGANTL